MSSETRPRPSVLMLEDDTPLADMILMTLGDEFDI